MSKCITFFMMTIVVLMCHTSVLAQCSEPGTCATMTMMLAKELRIPPLPPMIAPYPKYMHVHRFTDRNQQNCLNQPWCTKTTNNGNMNLIHDHIMSNSALTAEEIVDADRAIEYNRTFISKISSANPNYNCYSYGLYGTSSVWLSDTALALCNDFVQVNGGCSDPYQVGDLCLYGDDHASVITCINDAYGGTNNAASQVRSKWAWYGVYTTTDDGYGDYGDPDEIYRTY